MVAAVKFGLMLAAIVAIATAAPSRQSTLHDLTGLVKEYRESFEKLFYEKDELLRFARAALHFLYRQINEEVLINKGKTRNTIQLGIDGIEATITEKLQAGVEEKCLLALSMQLQDEKRLLGAGISACAAATSEIKDDVGAAFQANLEILQRLSTAISEYMVWSFSLHNSVTHPELHVDTMLRAYYELELLWRDNVLPQLQEEIDTMDAKRVEIVASNLNCLDGLVEKAHAFEEYIREKIYLCPAPYRA